LENDSDREVNKLMAKLFPDSSEDEREELKKRIDRGVKKAWPAMQKAESIIDRWQKETKEPLLIITVAVLSGFMASMCVKVMEIYQSPNWLYVGIFVVFLAFMIVWVVLLTRWFRKSTAAFVFGYMLAEATEEPLEADSGK